MIKQSVCAKKTLLSHTTFKKYVQCVTFIFQNLLAKKWFYIKTPYSINC